MLMTQLYLMTTPTSRFPLNIHTHHLSGGDRGVDEAQFSSAEQFKNRSSASVAL